MKDKNFSYDNYPSREIKEFGKLREDEMKESQLVVSMPLFKEIHESRNFWRTAALIGWTLLLLTAFHSYVLPNLI